MKKFLREINAIFTITMRDIISSILSPTSLALSLLMPIIMMGMLGGSLSQNMTSGIGFDYNKFMLVGMVINMLFMSTMMNITNLVEERKENFTQELYVSPISRYSIIIGKILGASFSSMIQLIGTFIVALFMGISLSLNQTLLLLLIAPFICLVSGSMAVIVIAFVKNSKAASIITSLFTMPQMFLSGAIIPLTSSSGILYFLSRIMPMTYCLDFVRTILFKETGQYISMFNPFICVTTLVVITIIFLFIGTYFFSKAETSK